MPPMVSNARQWDCEAGLVDEGVHTSHVGDQEHCWGRGRTMLMWTGKEEEEEEEEG